MREREGEEEGEREYCFAAFIASGNISLTVVLCWLCRGGMWINFSRHGSQCSTKHGSGRIKEANREYEISGLHGALAVI